MYETPITGVELEPNPQETTTKKLPLYRYKGEIDHPLQEPILNLYHFMKAYSKSSLALAFGETSSTEDR
jgi:hypothetical protein